MIFNHNIEIEVASTIIDTIKFPSYFRRTLDESEVNAIFGPRHKAFAFAGRIRGAMLR
jgi:hypothetical protein